VPGNRLRAIIVLNEEFSFRINIDWVIVRIMIFANLRNTWDLEFILVVSLDFSLILLFSSSSRREVNG